MEIWILIDSNENKNLSLPQWRQAFTLKQSSQESDVSIEARPYTPKMEPKFIRYNKLRQDPYVMLMEGRILRCLNESKDLTLEKQRKKYDVTLLDKTILR